MGFSGAVSGHFSRREGNKEGAAAVGATLTPPLAPSTPRMASFSQWRDPRGGDSTAAFYFYHLSTAAPRTRMSTPSRATLDDPLRPQIYFVAL
jgi:hypothetical protein